jgi:hypothetical protein
LIQPFRQPERTAVSSPKPSSEELAKLKQNPLSGLREIIFQAEVSPNAANQTAKNQAERLRPHHGFGAPRRMSCRLMKRNFAILLFFAFAVVLMPRNASGAAPVDEQVKKLTERSHL